MNGEPTARGDIKLPSAELIFGMVLNLPNWSDGEKHYLNFLYQSSKTFRKDLEALFSIDPIELKSRLDQERIKIIERLKGEIDSYLNSTEEFTQREKDYLKNNYTNKYFWGNLSNLVALGQFRKHNPTRDLVLEVIKSFMRKFRREKPETTAIANLDIEAWQNFQSRILPAAKRLNDAGSGEQVMVWMSTEVLLTDIRKAASKLPRSEVLGLINSLRKDESFIEIKKGLSWLLSHIYPTK